MNEGRIVQRGTLADLRGQPASEFVTEFINAQRSLAVLKAAKNQGAAVPSRLTSAVSSAPYSRHSCSIRFVFPPLYADPIVIGSKKFTESYVLAEIAKQSLERRRLHGRSTARGWAARSFFGKRCAAGRSTFIPNTPARSQKKF